MSEKTQRFSKELDRLISEGDFLHMAIQYECHPLEFEQQLVQKLDGEEEKVAKYIDSLPNFKNDYQKWYSAAQAVVKQVLPDRLNDFKSYYEFGKDRKNISFKNYMIRDYLQGLQITAYTGEVTVSGWAAIPEFVQQLNIVKAARGNLESSLMDLKAVLQADLFDSEVDTALALAKAGYLRASGAICGVVIEKHLRHVCGTHSLRVAKKNPGISDLAQLLRSSSVISLAQERFIQSLADTRNICSHAKGREPTKDEIADLCGGTNKVLKTVF